jgi:hypothetical protein
MSDAILTATQNLVQAFNNNTRAYIYNSGQYTSSTVAGGQSIQVASGGSNSGSTANTTGTGSGSGIGGRVVSASIVKGGTGTIKFYNSASITVLEDRNLLAVIENPTVGIHQVGQQFVTGLVMVVTGDISANCTYSLG